MADQTTKTLLLKIKSETGGIKDLSTAFAEAEKDAKASLDAQVKAINDLVKATEKAKKEEAKAAKEAAAEQSKQQKELLKEELAATRERNKQLAAEAKAQAKEAIQLAKDQARQVAEAAKETSQKSNAQAKYAEQRIKDEELLANRVRKIEIDSLKQTIEERNAILNAASKQRLGTAIGDITSAESSDRKKLLRSLREDMTERAKLQQEEFNLVERGLQQTRAREAERARIEENAARQRLERQAATNRQLLANETDFNERQRQNQLRGMRTSATEAFAPAARLAPIPRVPEDVRNSYDSLFARIGAINIEYRLWNTAINAVTNSLRAVPKIGIELESTKAALTASMGESGAVVAMEALKKEADRTGMSITALRESFRNFSASTLLAGQGLESTWKMFQNINTTATALHFSTDQVNHTFLALSQIFNKSKVQSEELVKQLGNLLPGAFAAFQKANEDLYSSPKKLSEAMKQGLVTASETVEKFTTYYAERFAVAFQGASEGLNANINRMNNSFTSLGEAIYGLSGGALNSAVKSITNLTNYFTAAVNGENDFIKNTKLLADVLTGTLVAGFLATLKPATMLMEGLYAAATAANVLKANLTAIGSTAVIAGLAAAVSYTWELGKARRAVLDATNEDTKALQKNAAARELYTPLETLAEEDPAVIKARKQLQSLQGIEAERRKLEQQHASKFTVSVLEEGSNETKAVLMDMKEAAKYMEDKLTAQKKIIDATIETAKVGVAATRELTKKKIGLDIGDPTYMATLEVKKLRSQADLFDSLAAKAKASKDYAEAARQETLARDTEFQAKSAQLRLDTKDELAKAKNDLELATKAKKDAEKNIAAGVDVLESTKLKQDAEEAIKEKSKAVDLVNNAIKNIEEKNAADLATYKASLVKSQQADDKKAAVERLKTTKEEINVAKQYQATATNEAENQLKLLKGENDAKIYSFEEFVRRKKALLTEDFQNQETYYNQEIALATKTGKKDLIAQYTEKLKQAKTTYETQVGTAETKGIIDNEAKQNIDAYNTNLNMIHERYQDILGIERDSNAITSAKLELIRQQLVLESTEKGEVGETAKQRLIELEVLKEARNLKQNIAINQKNLNTAEKITNDALQRNNELKQAGQLTELQYAISNTKIKREQVALAEKEVAAMKDKLDAAKPEARPAAQSNYDIAVQKLESLKLVANETGAFIENALGSAFESSFEGLITKSMTASQAFANFGNSVMKTIAKIIAEEMKSQLLSFIIKPLAGMALSGLGSLGQSAGLFQATNISSDANFVGPMKPTFAANGGVFTGPGISAHSGTIVSSPTVFPFAKGVGLMGEAGPEAILPLKRNAQGKLGVSVDNAGQSKSNLYNITVNVQSKEGENPEQFGQRAAAAMMRSIAKEEISNARRPGNTLNKSRFG